MARLAAQHNVQWQASIRRRLFDSLRVCIHQQPYDSSSLDPSVCKFAGRVQDKPAVGARFSGPFWVGFEKKAYKLCCAKGQVLHGCVKWKAALWVSFCGRFGVCVKEQGCALGSAYATLSVNKAVKRKPAAGRLLLCCARVGLQQEADAVHAANGAVDKLHGTVQGQPAERRWSCHSRRKGLEKQLNAGSHVVVPNSTLDKSAPNTDGMSTTTSRIRKATFRTRCSS